MSRVCDTGFHKRPTSHIEMCDPWAPNNSPKSCIFHVCFLLLNRLWLSVHWIIFITDYRSLGLRVGLLVLTPEESLQLVFVMLNHTIYSSLVYYCNQFAFVNCLLSVMGSLRSLHKGRGV